jgi:glutamate synthase (NADPH/NADH) large chain
LALAPQLSTPYLALHSIKDLKNSSLLKGVEYDEEKLKKNYIKAVNDGLLKVFSKMGISTLQSYQGAQIFEIIGINKTWLTNTSPVPFPALKEWGWMKLPKKPGQTPVCLYQKRSVPVDRLPVGGIYQWKRKGEFHLFNPQTIHLLQYATSMNDYATFKKYSKLVNEQERKSLYPTQPLQFKRNRPSISLMK